MGSSVESISQPPVTSPPSVLPVKVVPVESVEARTDLVATRGIEHVDKLGDAKKHSSLNIPLIIWGLILSPLTILPSIYFAFTEEVHPEESSLSHAFSKATIYVSIALAHILTAGLLAGGAWLSNRSSEEKLDELKNALGEAQFDAMKPALQELGIEGEENPEEKLFQQCKSALYTKYPGLDTKGLRKWVKEVLNVYAHVQKTGDAEKLTQWSKLMEGVVKSPFHQTLLAEDPPQPAVKFAQSLVQRSYTAKQETLQAYETNGGRILRAENLGNFDSAEMADAFFDSLDDMPAVYKQKPLEGVKDGASGGMTKKLKKYPLRFLWALYNPTKAFHAYEGHKFPLSYNSHQNGNQTAALWDYGNVRTVASPSQTCGVQMEQSLLRGDTEVLYHNLQSTVVEGEKERYAALLGMSTDQKMNLFTTPFDGKFWKKFEDWDHTQGSSDFFVKYRNYACTGDPDISLPKGSTPAFATVDAANLGKDNGFFIPDHVLSQDEVMKCFDDAEKIVKEMEKSPYYSKLKKVRQSQAMQLTTSALIAVRAIEKKVQKVEISQDEAKTILLQSCKQCIDRGPVMLILTKVLFDIKGGTTDWSEKDVKQMLGVLAGRPLQVDHRLTVTTRLTPLYDVLKLFGGKELEIHKVLISSS